MNDKYYRDRMLPLHNAVVKQVVVSSEDDGVYCGFIMQRTDGTVVEVIALADPEGNGPGHLTIEAVD